MMTVRVIYGAVGLWLMLLGWSVGAPGLAIFSWMLCGAFAEWNIMIVGRK